jgi:hypothetical protein
MIFVDTNSDSGSSFLLDAERRANEFIDHTDVMGYFRPYPADEYGGASALDPLLHYWYQKAPNPDEIMVFQDWGIEDHNIGSVEANSIYTRRCFCNPVEEWRGLEIARNPTFEKAFWTSWSRAKLQSGRVLPLNAIWGVRRRKKDGEKEGFTSSTDFISDAIHSEALNLWLWVLTELCPRTVYLCGSWARNGKEFGKRHRTIIPFVSYLDAWKSALVDNKEIVEKAREKLDKTLVYSLPHPSAYVSRAGCDLWETVDLANWETVK